MSLLSRKSLAKGLLKAKEFRDAFVSARITQTVAMQARVLREERRLSQADLAKELGTSQNAIYRLENPSYGKNSISTLRKVASFFDVGLVVRFERFSGIVDWVTDMDSESILVPSAEKDVRLQRAAMGGAKAPVLIFRAPLVEDAMNSRHLSGAGQSSRASLADPCSGTASLPRQDQFSLNAGGVS